MDRRSLAAGLPAAAAELREQLSLISAASQLLEATAGEQGLDCVASLNLGVYRMLRTVTRLELGHRLTAEHEQRLNCAPVELAGWTGELARRMAGVLAGAGVSLEWELPQRLPASVDCELLSHAVTELTALAALSGRSLKLKLTARQDSVCFDVTAEGEPLVRPLLPDAPGVEEDPGAELIRQVASLHGGTLVSCLESGRCRSYTLLVPRRPAGGTEELSAPPIPAADDGGFDPVLVAFSHLLPAKEFRPAP